MSLLDELPHRCSIRRRVRRQDAFGGHVDHTNASPYERTDVECWEQQASASEINQFAKRGIAISKKIYFTEDPHLTERHEIIITERNGVAVPNALANPLDVKSYADPDASAGLGVLYRVMVDNETSSQQ